MCGIAALFGEAVRHEALARMLRVAARRGPEGRGERAVAGGLLGHTALHFVDPLHNPQPWAAPDGSCITWNGEIYNWRSLAAQHGLDARNDTQTLLLGLLARGPAFITELDGQFAFVAQLARGAAGPCTLVGRDRWGICPLVFGYTPEAWLALGSTPETLQAAGVSTVKSVPAGMWGWLHGTQLALQPFYRLPLNSATAQRAVEPSEVRRYALQCVHSRIPAQPRELFTTLGGIDSQFVTASVARALGGKFAGAITVVPWAADAEHSDLPDVQATLALLHSEGIVIQHHVAVLHPDFVAQNLDRLIKLLGPDLFHLLCGLAEDLVAATAQQHGGRVIMTAGGPDEAGRSYDRWTFLHRGLNEELAWYRLCEQFGSSEGVRAGLVFGERGLENRVPLADLIDLATGICPEQKQRVLEEGDGLTLATLRMQSKIFWRQALAGLLPARCLAAQKQPIHGSTGALAAVHAVLARDHGFAARRDALAHSAWQRGWNGIVFGDLRKLDRDNPLTECQLYALYRFSVIEPELFRRGGEQRYGTYVGYLPRSFDEPAQRVHKPLCYDWQLGWDVPVRTIL